MKVIFLGPCRKINATTGLLYPAFALESRSGRFLRGVIGDTAGEHVHVEFDNIIDDAVVGADGREYLPSPAELVRALESHRIWVEADVVIALGGSVRKAFELVRKRFVGDQRRIAIHYVDHPSYVMRRPQSERDSFAERLLGLVKS